MASKRARLEAQAPGQAMIRETTPQRIKIHRDEPAQLQDA
jgi:hypothetical protein